MLVLETPIEINTILKQTKWEEDISGKGRAALALCKQSPSNNGIAKNQGRDKIMW